MGVLKWEWEWYVWDGNGNGNREWEQEWDCSLEVAGAGWAAQELHQPLAGLPAVMQQMPHTAHPMLQVRPAQTKKSRHMQIFTGKECASTVSKF